MTPARHVRTASCFSMPKGCENSSRRQPQIF